MAVELIKYVDWHGFIFTYLFLALFLCFLLLTVKHIVTGKCEWSVIFYHSSSIEGIFWWEESLALIEASFKALWVSLVAGTPLCCSSSARSLIFPRALLANSWKQTNPQMGCRNFRIIQFKTFFYVKSIWWFNFIQNFHTCLYIINMSPVFFIFVHWKQNMRNKWFNLCWEQWNLNTADDR